MSGLSRFYERAFKKFTYSTLEYFISYSATPKSVGLNQDKLWKKSIIFGQILIK